MLELKKTNFRVKSNVPDIKNKIEETSKEKALEAGELLHEEIKDTLKGQGHGRVYHLTGGGRQVTTRIGGRTVIRSVNPGGGRYRASEPGEPPAEASGLLLASIGYYVEAERSVRGKNYTVHVGSPLDYAKILEKGIGMQPRRFMFPSYQRKKRDVKSSMKDRWF